MGIKQVQIHQRFKDKKELIPTASGVNPTLSAVALQIEVQIKYDSPSSTTKLL